MKVLVTGSTGHLGEALVKRLNALNHDIIAVDVLPSDYTSHIGDISDKPFIEKCMQGVDVVLHTATLHKPHVVTHSKQNFIDTNISGTLVLLEAALDASVSSFIYTSTTSVFGDALSSAKGEATAWITEDVTPIPKNIYGVTKFAAENVCQLFYRNHQLPCLILRTSRFFLEQDDNPRMRDRYTDTNIKLNELLYRRVDIEDAVNAHLLAIEHAPKIGFDRFIISSTSPFQKKDAISLGSDAEKVIAEYEPDFIDIYERNNWYMYDYFDRVYINQRARQKLGWEPLYTFSKAINNLKSGKNIFSPLAYEVGIKGYHPHSFSDGPYPIN